MSLPHEVAEQIYGYYQPDDPAHGGVKQRAFGSARLQVVYEAQQAADTARDMTFDEFLEFIGGEQ